MRAKPRNKHYERFRALCKRVFQGTITRSRYIDPMLNLDKYLNLDGMRHFQFTQEIEYPERYLTVPLIPLAEQSVRRPQILGTVCSVGPPRKRASFSPVPDEPLDLRITDVRSMAEHCLTVKPLVVPKDRLLAPDEVVGVTSEELQTYRAPMDVGSRPGSSRVEGNTPMASEKSSRERK